jgi:HEPN domain-containing protein
MKPASTEWAAKAEGDFQTARRELAAAEAPNFDAVCFHAQQCAEKYLKAVLVEKGMSFPKIHDLSALLDMLLSSYPGWQGFRQECEALTDNAIEVRYPGFSADREDAAAALATAQRLRRAAREALGLPS